MPPGDGQLAKVLGKWKRIIGLDLHDQRLRHARRHPYRALIQGSGTSRSLP